MSDRPSCYEISFAPRQLPPPGYRVEWWESDEHYHWVMVDKPDDIYSVAFCCRWMCRRGAWKNYRLLNPPADAGPQHEEV